MNRKDAGAATVAMSPGNQIETGFPGSLQAQRMTFRILGPDYKEKRSIAYHLLLAVPAYACFQLRRLLDDDDIYMSTSAPEIGKMFMHIPSLHIPSLLDIFLDTNTKRQEYNGVS